MRRRLDLGASLVGAPRLLLLDEPTTGLDPRSRIELWDAIRALVDQGTDVLLTTQYLEEADQLADHVVIVDHGRAIADGTPAELKSLAGRDVVEIRARHAADLAAVEAVLAPFGDEAAPRRRAQSASGRPRRRRNRSPHRRGARACRRAAWRSTTSGSAARRSTRCSSPSPVSPADDSDHRRSHHRPCRARRLKERPAMTTTLFPSTVVTVVRTTTPIAAPASAPGYGATAVTVAGRTLRQFVRTPQLIVVGALTSAMFLLIFRYVFGGAIGTGDISYADFLIPGLAAAGAMFSGMGAAVGVAEDVESGLYDRFRSLPVPRSAVLFGRSLADTALVVWGLVRHRRHRLPHRVPDPQRRWSGPAGGRALRRLRRGVDLAVHLHGSRLGHRSGGAGDVVPRLPVRVRVERLRARRLDARLDAAGRREPADHGDGRVGAGLGARRER